MNGSGIGKFSTTNPPKIDDLAEAVGEGRRAQLIENLVRKGGFRARTNAMCIQCIYDEKSGGGTWRQQVEACTDTKCPLYDVRPVAQGRRG